MGFETFLRLIKERDSVTAGSVNTPLRQVDQNVRYLWDLIQASAIGSTVYAHQQTVETEVKVGMAVWLNEATQRFERGLALATVASGAVITAPSAQVWGVVSRKINATLADILLFGLDEIDLSQAVTGDVTAGVYYLSGSAPGKLVKQRPPVSVAVLRSTGDGRVFVMPQFMDALDAHTHYKFALVAYPAGTTSPPADGERHVITVPDATLQGWLPADHASFQGDAPAGAVFGYNLAAHPELASVWPPIPADNAYLELDRGLDGNIGSTGVPLGRDGLCVLDRNGIWWMSDCHGDAPWPLETDTSTPTSYSDSSSAECPRHLEMAMTLWFSRVNFATDQSAVLSLHSGDSRVNVTCLGTATPASTGHLQITLDLNLTVADDQTGYLALKEFNASTSAFKRGPVVEGVYSLSSNLALSGSVSGVRTVNSVSRTVYQGLVGVSVQPRDTLELDVQLVRLGSAGAEESFFQDLMYLGFAAAQEREYRAKVQVPSDLALESPKLKLRFLLLGRAAGTLPALEMTARRVPRPSGTTPEDLPLDADEFTVTCDTEVLLTDTNQYVEVESNTFDIAAGDTVFFTVRRLSTDGYGAEVGVLRQAGVVVVE